MKKLLIALCAAPLLFGGVARAQQAKLPTAVESISVGSFRWERFGADPAYRSRGAAMADRANVFRKFGYDEATVSCLVAGTAKSGVTIHLDVGDRLGHMLSGHGVVHSNTVIAFQFKTRGIEYTAIAEEWTVRCGSRTLVVGLPEVCQNWYDRVPPPAPECARLLIHLPAGRARAVRYALERHAPITNFNCWGIIAGQYREGAPRNCDTCVWTEDGLVVVRRYFHLPDDSPQISYYHVSIYPVPDDATSGNRDGSLDVTIVFPPEAIEEGVSPCIEIDGVIYPAAVVLPGSWKNLKAEIPLDYWQSPRVIPPVNPQ